MLDFKGTRGGPSSQLWTSCGLVLKAFGSHLVLLALQHPRHTYAIIDENGKELWRERLGHGADRILGVSGSAAANRVAIPYGSLRNSIIHGWVTTDHIVILDADKKRRITEVDYPGKGEHIVSEWQVFNTTRLALSPDGRLLAVLRSDGDALELLAIP